MLFRSDVVLVRLFSHIPPGGGGDVGGAREAQREGKGGEWRQADAADWALRRVVGAHGWVSGDGWNCLPVIQQMRNFSAKRIKNFSIVELSQTRAIIYLTQLSPFSSSFGMDTSQEPLGLFKVVNTPPMPVRYEDLKTWPAKNAFDEYETNMKRVFQLIDAPIFAMWAGRGESVNDFTFFSENGMIQTSEVKALEDAVLNAGPTVRDTFDNLLKSIVVQGWTTVELMMEDLWVRAINSEPVKLSKYLKLPDRNKSITLAELSMYSFNLSEDLGEFLKTKFNFSSADDRTRAYETAFKMDASVASAAKDTTLQAFTHLRNVVAHSNGVIDTKFLGKAKGCKPLASLAQLGLGAKIPINGKLIDEFVWGSFQRGATLVKTVDDWLAKHETKRSL